MKKSRSVFLHVVFGGVFIGILLFAHTLSAAAQSSVPFSYIFDTPGILQQAPSASQSTSPYFWLKSGAELVIQNGRGSTLQGSLPQGNSWRTAYAAGAPVISDQGTHPQNEFLLFTKAVLQNTTAQIYFDRVADNLSNSANKEPYNGETLIARYQDANDYYYATLRADGTVTINKSVNGVYKTLASKKIFSGTYSTQNPDLIPRNTWIGMKFVVSNDTAGNPELSLYTDVGWTNTWKLSLSATDSSNSISSAGTVGVRSDYADALFDNFLMGDAGTVSAPVGTPPVTPPTPPVATSNYDSLVLAANPVLYLDMNSASSNKETDQSGHGLSGTYKGGTPSAATLPNGDTAADFNGSGEYLTVPSSATLSISTTHQLTYEAWIRPDTFNFPNESDDGYVDWMGKCENYSPNCEWEARIYGASTPESRPDRLSAYVFNPSAGLGSAADWQPSSGTLQSGHWIHVVAEYDTTATPAGCSSSDPGTINIWVDGVKQNFADHAPTGCMSEYGITPKAGNSPLDIGTMAMDTWFSGAVGKVAVYDRLLSQSEINSHFQAMTGQAPSGSCGVTCVLTTIL